MKQLGLLGICLLLICSRSSGQTPEAAEAERASANAALALVERLQLLQFPVRRQAILEIGLDESAKNQAGELMATAETDLRPLVSDAAKQPQSLEVLVEKGRQRELKLDAALHQLLDEKQVSDLVQRARLIQRQLLLITGGPTSMEETFARLKLTAEQRQKMDPLLTATTGRIHALADEFEHRKQPAATSEQLIVLSIQARTRFRSLLTAEQLETFDSSMKSPFAPSEK